MKLQQQHFSEHIIQVFVSAGVSHLMEYMAFKATQNRTHFRLVREVRPMQESVLTV